MNIDEGGDDEGHRAAVKGPCEVRATGSGSLLGSSLFAVSRPSFSALALFLSSPSTSFSASVRRCRAVETVDMDDNCDEGRAKESSSGACGAASGMTEWPKVRLLVETGGEDEDSREVDVMVAGCLGKRIYIYVPELVDLSVRKLVRGRLSSSWREEGLDSDAIYR